MSDLRNRHPVSQCMSHYAYFMQIVLSVLQFDSVFVLSISAYEIDIPMDKG